MTDNTQPEALRLAQELDEVPETGADPEFIQECATVLRRQHARIADLEAQLEAIGAGGVSALMGAAKAAHKEPVAPHGWLYDWTHSSATGRPDETYTGFTKDEQHARKHDNCTPVYTAPPPTQPQAGAVPLTDEQIKDLQDDGVFLGTCRQIVRAIEAAHGIKEGGQHG